MAADPGMFYGEANLHRKKGKKDAKERVAGGGAGSEEAEHGSEHFGSKRAKGGRVMPASRPPFCEPVHGKSFGPRCSLPCCLPLTPLSVRYRCVEGSGGALFISVGNA